MIYLSKEDYFEVYLASMISNYDRDVIFSLYQPIIGHDAVSIYFSLYSEFKKQELNGISLHEDLFSIMDINCEKFQESRHLLEGIGLLQTYYKKDDNNVIYYYLLYAPKCPSDFFNDVLLKGLLVRSIGEKKANQLANIYKSRECNLNGFMDISYSFIDAFHPDLDSNDFYSNVDGQNSYQKQIMDISKGFSYSDFLKEINTVHGIKEETFSDSELKQISSLSLLFGIEEIVMADLVSQCINEKGNLDLDYLRKKCEKDLSFSPIRSINNIRSNDNFSGKSNISKKAEWLSKVSTIDFLKTKQNNGAIPPSDIQLVNILANEYGLTPKVINPLLDYVLENYDNCLPKNLVLKIAGSLVRNNISSTLDAMNFLFKIKNHSNNEKEKTIKKQTKKEVTDEDIQALLDEIGDN